MELIWKIVLVVFVLKFAFSFLGGATSSVGLSGEVIGTEFGNKLGVWLLKIWKVVEGMLDSLVNGLAKGFKGKKQTEDPEPKTTEVEEQKEVPASESKEQNTEEKG